MLIRIKGGNSGIKEYLETGQKSGRNYSREEMDERVILAGDLNFTNTLIQNMQTKVGERYLHITLAFKEDEISKETLQNITQDFKQFVFSAYMDDEYHFYAEAHLPKLKSYVDQGSGELIERKPHIHIVIPKINLLSQQNLNPLGSTGQQVQFLEAIQEQINNQYGLASPKDNRRVKFTSESTIITRYKGDYFKGAQHELKEQLLTKILENNITNYKDFTKLATQYGAIKTRNQNQATDKQYLNIQPKNHNKGINLKEYVFSREFIELPLETKKQKLNQELSHKYETARQQRPSNDIFAQRLIEWHEIRAKEIKYMNSGNQKTYTAYKSSTREQQANILAERAANFYAKHQAKQQIHDKTKQQEQIQEFTPKIKKLNLNLNQSLNNCQFADQSSQ